MLYGTIAGWQSYVASRGILGQTIVDPISQPVLVRASDYVHYHYVVNFMSQYDGTLPEVEMAVYEAACIENLSPSFFTTTYTPATAKVLVAVDSLRWEKTKPERDMPDNSGLVPISTKIEMYLRRFMRSKYTVGILSVG